MKVIVCVADQKTNKVIVVVHHIILRHHANPIVQYFQQQSCICTQMNILS